MRRHCGLYGRISDDKDGTGAGVERQREDCRSLADRVGIEVVDEYLDNDVSAWDKRKKRPEFERMLDDMRSGRIDTIVVWRSDRLARQPRDLERVIDALERSAGQLLSVTEPEFSGPTGLLILRMLGAFASHESAVKSERVARKWKAAANDGRPHAGGRRVFGYTRDFEPHPTEAPLLREAVNRVLAGERPYNVKQDWNARQVCTITGSSWTTSNFIRMLRAPVFAGIRVYHGERLDGSWEPLVARDRWDALQAALSARSRPQRLKRSPKYLLTGLAVCGACKTHMGGTTRGAGRTTEYRCRAECGGCGRVTMVLPKLEEIVLERFFHVVGTPTFDRLLSKAVGATVDTANVLAQLRDDEASLEQLTKDHYVERAISRPAFMAAKTELDARIKSAQRKVARTASPLVTLPRDEKTLRAQWPDYSEAKKRAVLEHCVDRIVVAHTGRNRYIDRVRIEWKA